MKEIVLKTEALIDDYELARYKNAILPTGFLEEATKLVTLLCTVPRDSFVQELKETIGKMMFYKELSL